MAAPNQGFDNQAMTPDDMSSVTSDSRRSGTLVTAPTGERKWVRFDDSCSTETTFSDAGSIAAEEYSISMNPSGAVGGQPKVRLASRSTASTDPSQVDVAMNNNNNNPRHPGTAHGRSVSRQSGHSVASSAVSGRSGELTNGKLLAMIRPSNRTCPWMVPASFDAYKIPSSLTSPKLALPVEEYVAAMELLINDFRFRFYTVCYRRIIVCWLLIMLVVLIALLVGMRGYNGLLLFGVALIWFFFLGVGILLCLYLKKRMMNSLCQCVMAANKILIKYHLLLGIEDQGQLSCQKIYIPFVYFNTSECVRNIAIAVRRHDEMFGHGSIDRMTMDLDEMGRKRQLNHEERAQRLVLKHSQKYVKGMVRKTNRFPTRPFEGVLDMSPLHCRHSLCLCQYLQKHEFERRKPKWYQRIC